MAALTMRTNFLLLGDFGLMQQMCVCRILFLGKSCHVSEVAGYTAPYDIHGRFLRPQAIHHLGQDI